MEDRDPVKTFFEEWARPGHFSRTIAKGSDTTTWIWNLHADAHDFDSHTSGLEEISRKVFSAHFGQLSIIFLWLSEKYFHGARFFNYEAWLGDPTHIGPSAQVVCPMTQTQPLWFGLGSLGLLDSPLLNHKFSLWQHLLKLVRLCSTLKDSTNLAILRACIQPTTRDHRDSVILDHLKVLFVRL